MINVEAILTRIEKKMDFQYKQIKDSISNVLRQLRFDIEKLKDELMMNE